MQTRENMPLQKERGNSAGKGKSENHEKKVSENGNWGDEAYIHTGNETKAKPKGKLELIQKNYVFRRGG